MITFKQFSKVVDLPEDEITEAKLDEIFGIFGGKKDDKLAKAKAERERLVKQLGAAQYALRLKQKNKAMQKAGQAANASQKPARDVRSAAGARAAERDWVASLQNESLTEGKAEINALARTIAKASEVSLPKKFLKSKPDKTIDTGLKAPEFNNKLDIYYDRDETGAVKWTYVDAYGERYNSLPFRLKGEVSPSDLKAAYKVAIWIGSGEPKDIGFKDVPSGSLRKHLDSMKGEFINVGDDIVVGTDTRNGTKYKFSKQDIDALKLSSEYEGKYKKVANVLASNLELDSDFDKKKVVRIRAKNFNDGYRDMLATLAGK